MKKAPKQTPKQLGTLSDTQLRAIRGGQGVDINLPPHGPPKG